MTSTLSIPLSAIIEGDRARKDYGDLSGLKDSLQRLGTIHPPGFSKRVAAPEESHIAHEGFVYDLCVGGRRYRSLKELNIKELFYGSMGDPNKMGFLFKDDIPEDELREMELDENLYRLKPKWQEDALLIADVHELKRKRYGANKWGQRHTADLLGPGYSKSSVGIALKAAALLRSGDKEILACETMMDATAVRIKRAEDSALAELQRRTLPAAQTLTSPTSTSSFLDLFNINLNGGDPTDTKGNNTTIGSAAQPTSNVPSVGVGLQNAPLETRPPVQVPLSSMFLLGDCISLPWPTTNHIVTDIPYGIDMDNLNKKMVVDVVAEHEVEANVALMPQFLQKAWDSVLPHGFCVFFYDLDHHEKLQTWARDIGWKVQRWPLIWAKTHACQNNAAQYNTTKNFEVAMILRKDEHTVLRSQQPSSVWSGDGAAERKLYNNPFAKPFELWKWIFDMVAFSGQTVLDPFCGEMSSSRAAANCGLVPYGIEINDKHYNRGLENMRKVYAVIHKSNVEFV